MFDKNLFSIKIKQTVDGADAIVWFKGVVVLVCTYMGESEALLIEQAINSGECDFLKD